MHSAEMHQRADVQIWADAGRAEFAKTGLDEVAVVNFSIPFFLFSSTRRRAATKGIPSKNQEFAP